MAIVITDGEPSDKDNIIEKIIEFTKKITKGRSEFGISFIQVGHDEDVAKFLNFLDDNLSEKGAKLDIVDTKNIDEVEEIGLIETLLAALRD